MSTIHVMENGHTPSSGAARHVVVVRQRKIVDEQPAHDDDGRGKGDAGKDTAADD